MSYKSSSKSKKPSKPAIIVSICSAVVVIAGVLLMLDKLIGKGKKKY